MTESPTQGAPSFEFVFPSEHASLLVSEIRARVPQVLIGSKALPDGNTFFSITGYSRRPGKLAKLANAGMKLFDQARFSSRPRKNDLSLLVERARQACGLDQGQGDAPS